MKGLGDNFGILFVINPPTTKLRSLFPVKLPDSSIKINIFPLILPQPTRQINQKNPLGGGGLGEDFNYCFDLTNLSRSNLLAPSIKILTRVTVI